MLGDVTGIQEAAVFHLFPFGTQLWGLRPVFLLVYHGDRVLLASRCRRDNLGPVLFSVTTFRVLGHSGLQPVPKLVSSKRNDTSELVLIRIQPLRLVRVRLHLMLLDTWSREEEGV